MVQGYPQEYLERFEVIDETYSEGRYPNARKLRDQRARQLRREGWTVECRKWDFIDLARCYAYSLHAEREKRR